MISFDSSEISNWAGMASAQHELPELLRRLILATIPMPSLLEMPSGSSVWLPGWDGLLVTRKGNAWVPDGTSAWEFSRARFPGSKATADYRKRTENSHGVYKPNATFVFVTPRKWKGKKKWATERDKEGDWSQVRAFNADDLAAWLGQAPTVAHWFARLIRKLPATGVTPLGELWENWSSITKPEISPELVIAGRRDNAERLAEWFQDEASHYYVQGDTRDEVIAFLAACAHASATRWGAALLERTIVVHDADAWRSVEGHPTPLVLVRDFSDSNVSSQIAVRSGHHVLIPLSGHQEPSGTGITLPRLGRDETRQALISMGISETKSRSLARSTARRMAIIRRQLIDESGGSTPGWALPSSPHSIVALALVGQWQGDHEGDKAIVAEVLGQQYEVVEREVAAQMSVSDSALTRIGNRWRFVSHEEAWYLLAPRMTSTDIERFERVATEVLGAVSPALELPIEERYMAGALGKGLPHSGTLREGIARSLALMGTHSDRLRSVEGAKYVPMRVVSNVLGNSEGWQTWATLRDSLAVLAEASPEALLNSIERGLSISPSPFHDLFAQEGDGLFAGVPHTGVLWALEMLAWSRAHFARVAKTLAQLAEMDPGGQVSNRPIESLKSFFLPWIRFSEASDSHRLETIKMLLNTVPTEGWKLLVGVYPTSHGHVTNRHPPSWRPWGQDGAPQPTRGEYNLFVGALERLLLGSVGTNINRWSDLVRIISGLSAESRQDAIELLSVDTDALRQHPDAGRLRASLREVLHHHNSYPEAAWVMDQSDIRALEAVYMELIPADPVAAYAWLFGNWPNLPEGKSHDYRRANEQISEARLMAVGATYESGGVSAILDIAESAEEPYQVGIAVGNCLDSRMTLNLALNHLGSTSLRFRQFSSGILRAQFSLSGWKPLEDTLNMAKSIGKSAEAIADIYLTAPTRRATWHRLDNECQEVRATYWESVGWLAGGEWDSEELVFAVKQLLSVRRSADVVRWLALTPMPVQLVVEILEAVPNDSAVSEDGELRIDAFHIGHLFEILDQSDEVTDDLIAKLEVPFVGMLEYDRPHLALHREVTRQPWLFADLITWAFMRADGQMEEAVDEQTRKRRAILAYNLIWKLRILPGLMEDESVDHEKLSAWVIEVRRLCKERARGDVGDQQVGKVLANAPVGKDGIWPCEPVRDLLDTLSAHHVGVGFVVGKSNLRGVTSRSLFEGGQRERSIADKYRHDADGIAAKWPFTAQLLRKLATDYESEAIREDQRADWTDQFEA